MYLSVLEEVLADTCCECEVLPLVLVEAVLINEACEEYCCEE